MYIGLRTARLTVRHSTIVCMDAYQRTLASMTLQVSMPVSAPDSLKITQSAQNNEEKLLTLAMLSQWLE